MTESDAPRPLKVFLSYAHADAAAVRSLYNRLVADGVDAWLDKENLLPGQDWEREIRKAVREADVVVVCLSKQFNQRGYRQKEVRIALNEAEMMPEGEIFLIPARLEECEAPESLQKWHWVDLFEPEGYERLLRALRVRAEQIGAAFQLRKGVLSQVFKKPMTSSHQPGKKTPMPRPRKKPLKTEYVVALITAAATILAAFLGSPLIEKWVASRQDPMATFALSPTPYPEEILDTDPAGNEIPMRLVQAGEFTMGSENGDDDEIPVHTVYLDSFYMDQYEVTNALYKGCVDVGACEVPSQSDSYTHSDYYGSVEYNNYPVIYVDWYQAKAYCEWRDAALPTEAQWEKAARGTDTRTYPWGEGIDCARANYRSACAGDTSEVGSYERGKSPYGIYDMAGNVWEWVADWYARDYYANSWSVYPLGPAVGVYKVRRGGSWDYGDLNSRVSNRSKITPEAGGSSTGFRCVRSVSP